MLHTPHIFDLIAIYMLLRKLLPKLYDRKLKDIEEVNRLLLSDFNSKMKVYKQSRD